MHSSREWRAPVDIPVLGLGLGFVGLCLAYSFPLTGFVILGLLVYRTHTRLAVGNADANAVRRESHDDDEIWAGGCWAEFNSDGQSMERSHRRAAVRRPSKVGTANL
jgi:hypothetical protein